MGEGDAAAGRVNISPDLRARLDHWCERTEHSEEEVIDLALRRLMRNDGDFKFVDVSERFGLTGIGPTYQAGWGDFNNDGYLDLVAHGKLLRNPGGDNHWLKVKLVAKDGTINASAVGGQVRIAVPGSGTLTRQVETATGQGNQNELTMHFGIGSYDGALTLDVFWPDGQTTEVAVDGVDRLVVIDR